MEDLWNFIIAVICSLILGAAGHSTLGHYCKNRFTGLCRFFHRNGKEECEECLDEVYIEGFE